MKISIRQRLGFGLGDFGNQFAYAVVSTYFMIFMTNIMGIKASTAGVIYAVVMIFDAINDPIIGNLADKTKTTKMGKYRKWMIAASVPYAVSMWLSFLNPNVGMAGKIAWAFIIHMIYSICGTSFQIPFGAIPNRMTTDPHERVILGTFRDWFANLAKFLIGILGVNLIYKFSVDGQSLDASGYFGFAGVCCLVCIIFCLIGGLSAKEHAGEEIERLAEKEKESRTEIKKMNAFKSYAYVFKNRPALTLMLVSFAGTLALNFKAAFTSYYALYYLNSATMISIILAAYFAIPLVLEMFVPILLRKFGEKKLLFFCMLLLAVSGICGLTGTGFAINIIGALIISGALTFLPPTLWGTLPTLADYGEWKFGVVNPGAVYSLNAFCLKAAMGVTGLLSGFALTRAGYDAALEVQTASCAQSINLWYNAFPLVCGIIGLVFVLLYNMTPALKKQFMGELTERRKQAAEEADKEVSDAQ